MRKFLSGVRQPMRRQSAWKSLINSILFSLAGFSLGAAAKLLDVYTQNLGGCFFANVHLDFVWRNHCRVQPFALSGWYPYLFLLYRYAVLLLSGGAYDNRQLPLDVHLRLELILVNFPCIRLFHLIRQGERGLVCQLDSLRHSGKHRGMCNHFV